MTTTAQPLTALPTVARRPSSLPSSPFDRAYAFRTLALLSAIAALIVYIDVMLTPALPTIAAEYGVSIAQTSLLISLYTVFGVAVMPIIGKLGDIYGKKRVMVLTLAAYLAIATTTSFAPTFDLILASRFFQGIGLGVFPLCFSLAREQFPRALVPRAQGLISAVQVAGGAFGLLVGAVFTLDFGWQANYHLALPCILVLTVLAVVLVRESENRKAGVHLDYVGASWLGASLTALVLGLSEGASWGWSSLPTLGLVVGGVGLLLPLALYELRQSEPVLDLHLLRQRNVMISNVLMLAYGASVFLSFQAITYYMQLPAPSGFGLNTVQTGLYLLPLIVVILPVAYGVGIVIPNSGVKPFLYLGALLGGVSFLLLSTATSPAEVGGFLAVYAVGSGLLSVSIQNLLVLSLAKSEMGLGTSLNSAFRYIGQSLGAPLSGAILSTFVSAPMVAGGARLVLPTHLAFQFCFYTAAAVFVVVGVAALFAHEVMGPRAPKESTTPVRG
ncbi:MAG: MFS transporter [Thermoplasmata archaeon]|nr:MFS transporter [Thermoplasmata archaeon]